MHDRALFDLGNFATSRTANLLDDLLDHELDIGTSADIREDPDVFEAHQRPDDLTRVAKDKGASGLLSHTSSLERLCSIRGGPSGTAGPR